MYSFEKYSITYARKLQYVLQNYFEKTKIILNYPCLAVIKAIYLHEISFNLDYSLIISQIRSEGDFLIILKNIMAEKTSDETFLLVFKTR